MQLSPGSRPATSLRAARRAKQLHTEQKPGSAALEQRHIVQLVLSFAAPDGYLSGCVSRLWRRESWLDITEEKRDGHSVADSAADSGCESSDGAEGGDAAISADDPRARLRVLRHPRARLPVLPHWHPRARLRVLPNGMSLSAVVQSGSRVAWALGSGLKWSSQLSVAAARIERGLDVLKWGMELKHLRFRPKKNVTGLVSAAAEAGHFETLKWARAGGCNWYDSENLIETAAELGHLHTVKWAQANGCPWGPRADKYGLVLSSVTKGGHFELVKWLWENDSPRGTDQFFGDTTRDAASSGHLEMLQWLVAQGYSWDGTVCFEAARGGHLDVIQWARDNGCSWPRAPGWEPCAGAAKFGHLEVIQWLRANGCPWGEGTCEQASSSDSSRRQEVLDWLHANGCPCKHTGISSEEEDSSEEE